MSSNPDEPRLQQCPRCRALLTVPAGAKKVVCACGRVIVVAPAHGSRTGTK